MQRFPSTLLRQSLRAPVRALSTSRAFLAPVPKPESELTHPALLKDPPIANPSAATDPWSLAPPPLAFIPDSGPTMTMAELMASPHPEFRDSEDVETLRKRLVYESRKRGILEMELILSTFTKARLETMDEGELREYDRFLTMPDWTIYYYCTNKASAPEPWASSWVLGELLKHSSNSDKKVLTMPALEFKPKA